MINFRASLLFLMAISSAGAVLAGAQPKPYVVVGLSKGLAIELPRNWRVFNQNQMITLEAAVVARGTTLGEADFSSDLSFAANYYDDNGNTAGMVNLRHYPDQLISEPEVRQFSARDLRIYDDAAKGQISQSFIGSDLKLIAWIGTSPRPINGLTALVSEYRRTSQNGIFRVRLVRILDAARSFTLTVSYREDQSTILQPITDYVISTLRRR
ncbi:MAG: hypothetical protein Q7R30_16610 [Acidobacteriota bacterium]|nr:hypothetical protein [Acidobacteriota bacterium]